MLVEKFNYILLIFSIFMAVFEFFVLIKVNSHIFTLGLTVRWSRVEEYRLLAVYCGLLWMSL